MCKFQITQWSRYPTFNFVSQLQFALSSCGTRLATCSENGKLIRIWDPALMTSGSPLLELERGLLSRVFSKPQVHFQFVSTPYLLIRMLRLSPCHPRLVLSISSTLSPLTKGKQGGFNYSQVDWGRGYPLARGEAEQIAQLNSISQSQNPYVTS